ncbi:glycosyltransferase [Bacteroides faecis]|uniref:glycosyltransferase n=1 Tax=Bacteroides faecis TaxID=674529 RepID=UPI0021654C73|nr:glycosyltransferase [Bacteroides faecis]MCS2551311.1 glycosyltransferase [Bacteroides faecis]
MKTILGTLKEAMSVGVPCVASYVGGVPEYARNKENCLLYRFEDYEHLAMNLISLFRSQELCQKLSVQSRFDMKIVVNRMIFIKFQRIFIELF